MVNPQGVQYNEVELQVVINLDWRFNFVDVALKWHGQPLHSESTRIPFPGR